MGLEDLERRLEGHGVDRGWGWGWAGSGRQGWANAQTSSVLMQGSISKAPNMLSPSRTQSSLQVVM